jgi:hypothetical protein
VIQLSKSNNGAIILNSRLVLLSECNSVVLEKWKNRKTFKKFQNFHAGQGYGLLEQGWAIFPVEALSILAKSCASWELSVESFPIIESGS